MPRDLAAKETALRSAIKAAAKAGNTNKVSAAKHLRKVVEDLREDSQGVLGEGVPPYLLQSVVARGATEDADRAKDNMSSRQRMSDDTQEDTFEYYQLLLNDLIADLASKDGNALKAVFDIETGTRDCCTNSDCAGRSNPRKSTNNYHNVDVMVPRGEQLKSLKELLETSMESPIVGSICKNCDDVALTAMAAFSQVPDSLVIRMNRTSFGKQANKVTAVIDMNETLNLQGSQYRLDAVVMHKGTTNRGHYTICRKYQERWYRLDDKQCIAKGPGDMAAVARKRGLPVMPIYKRVKA